MRATSLYKRIKLRRKQVQTYYTNPSINFFFFFLVTSIIAWEYLPQSFFSSSNRVCLSFLHVLNNYRVDIWLVFIKINLVIYSLSRFETFPNEKLSSPITMLMLYCHANISPFFLMTKLIKEGDAASITQLFIIKAFSHFKPSKTNVG